MVVFVELTLVVMTPSAGNLWLQADAVALNVPQEKKDASVLRGNTMSPLITYNSELHTITLLHHYTKHGDAAMMARHVVPHEDISW